MSWASPSGVSCSRPKMTRSRPLRSISVTAAERSKAPHPVRVPDRPQRARRPAQVVDPTRERHLRKEAGDTRGRVTRGVDADEQHGHLAGQFVQRSPDLLCDEDAGWAARRGKEREHDHIAAEGRQ